MPKILNIPLSDLKELYLVQKLSPRKIAKIYNCAYSTIDYKIHQAKLPTRNLAEAHVIYPRINFSDDLIEKAYLIGFRIGDLRVRKIYKNSETILVDCASTKSEQIELISKLFSKYGRVWTSHPNQVGRVQIQCHLNLSFNFLLSSKLEGWIINNKEYFFSFLAGFTDADGSIFIANGQATYSLGNYNIALLKEIKFYLEFYGISSRKITFSDRKGLLASHGYRYNSDYWTLAISRKKNLIMLFEFFSRYLKHENRIKQMNEAISNIQKRNKLYGK